MPDHYLSDRDATFMILHPRIFGPGPWHDQPSPICWSLQIGNGWMPLLARLCEDLEQIIRDDQLVDFRVHQVKEKFGGLRVYAQGGNAACRARIDAAERHSMTIYEICGAPGRLGANGGWRRTLCGTCRERR